MIKKKSLYQEDNKTSLNDNTIKLIGKNKIIDSLNNKENTKYDSNSKNESEIITLKKVRGRQLKPQNSYNISIINNKSLSKSSACKKRSGNKCKFYSFY